MNTVVRRAVVSPVRSVVVATGSTVAGASRGSKGPQRAQAVMALLERQANRARDQFARAEAALPAEDARSLLAARIMGAIDGPKGSVLLNDSKKLRESNSTARPIAAHAL